MEITDREKFHSYVSDSLAQSDRYITQLINKSTDMLRSQKGRIDVMCC